MPHRQALEQAQQHLNAARHLLHVTFPALKDAKLLTGVVGQLFTAGEAAMDAWLLSERQLRLVPPFGNTFTSKFAVFRSSARRNHMDAAHAGLLEELKELVELQKTCPTEFRRSDSYVFATERFRLRTVAKKEVDGYYARTKAFLADVKILLQNREKADFKSFK
ncbi:hypothetical protein HYS49_00345, partial [Candidatus Woesearchaeota archaeon]|nr:hypothetical protein [Candidatus Woesearchaeota archaeon]